MDKTTHKKSKYRDNSKKERKQLPEQTYRFRRVLGDILGLLKSLPHNSMFQKAQKEYGEQLTELIQKGYTWGYEYPIPVHDSDFSTLEKKEWAAIRAIVRKQEYGGNNPDY